MTSCCCWPGRPRSTPDGSAPGGCRGIRRPWRGPARRRAKQLGAWGLTELAFATELIVSELVTNAVRYGDDPVVLRLIRDSTLICEVSDGSSTAPHLRRARVFDEGGRGLLLVAQLAERWGSRQTPTGKTIWAEQALPPGTPPA
jgi:hypothetical protein